MLWTLSCYWCHPLIIFHSCFQYPALYTRVGFHLLCVSICVCFVRANMDSANTSACFICVFVFVHYINSHTNLYARVHSLLCVGGCVFKIIILFTTMCVLVCVVLTDYEPSVVCQTTEAVSFDCIDLVPVHAVMKDEKWTAWSECEVIGLHLVSHWFTKVARWGRWKKPWEREVNFTWALLYANKWIAVYIFSLYLDDREHAKLQGDVLD